jgi:hypothetical protein
MNIVFFALFVAFFAGLIAFTIKLGLKENDPNLRSRIEDEFRTLVINSKLPELSFDGRTAEIVDDRVEGEDYETPDNFTLYRVHRFARNSHGEYFLFISDGSGKPFFKHVSQANARIALGSKYVAPVRSNE